MSVSSLSSNSSGSLGVDPFLLDSRQSYDNSSAAQAAVPFKDTTNNRAQNKTKDVVSKCLPSHKLPETLRPIYERNGSSFETIAQNPEELSQFLNELLTYNTKEVSRVCAQFSGVFYNTSYSLTLNFVTDDTLSSLKWIRCKFIRPKGLKIVQAKIASNMLERALKALPGLKRLELDDIQSIATNDFITLAFSHTLKVVEIRNCHIDDAGVRRILDCCPSLISLGLDSCPHVTFDQIEKNKKFSLRQLYVNNCGHSDAGMRGVEMLFPNLRIFQVYDCRNLTKDAFADVEFPKSLLELDLVGLKISDASFTRLVSQFQKLECLKVLDCSNLSRNVFLKMQWPVSLQELVIRNAPIDGEVIEKLFKQCWRGNGINNAAHSICIPQGNNASENGKLLPLVLVRNLSILDLEKCNTITNEDFRNFEYPESLQSINFNETQIDEAGLHHLVVYAPDLKEISLNNCPNLPQRFWQEYMTMDSLKKLLADESAERAALASSVEDALFDMQL